MIAPGRRYGGPQLVSSLLCGAFAAAVGCEAVAAQTTLLSQPPNRTDAHLSDAKLNSMIMWPTPTGVCAAENFVLPSTSTIARIRIWGVYSPGGGAPATDSLTVTLHGDAAGLPGAVLSTQSGVPASRRPTGEAVGGLAEYVYSLPLDPVARPPGSYWIEVCNDTTGNAPSFFWEFGTVDPARGVPAAAYVLTAPAGNAWQVLDVDSNRRDLAIEISAQPVAEVVPTLTDWGLALLGVLLGAGGAGFARRGRATAR